MEVQKTLRPGRAFEKDTFGKTDEVDYVDPNTRPARRSYGRSVKMIVDQTWAEYEEAIRKGMDLYNPTNPEVGKTNIIFKAVKKHLPRRVLGRRSCPLNLYIAVGRTSLDWHYGVDAFFVWEGVSVTVDLSTRHKDREDFKADFLFEPEDLAPDRLEFFGQKVAELLKNRRQSERGRTNAKKREIKKV